MSQEPQQRITVVEAQRQVEFEMAGHLVNGWPQERNRGQLGYATFFVEQGVLTPLLFNPNDIARVGIADHVSDYKKIGHDDAAKVFIYEVAHGNYGEHFRYAMQPGKTVPDGAMPDAKRDDPAQLDTVLGRVLSMEALFKAGAAITVVTPHVGRKHAANPAAEVAPAAGSLIHTYGDRIDWVTIEPEEYRANKNRIGAATYLWQENSGASDFYVSNHHNSAVIFASQISAPNSDIKFDRLFGNTATEPYRENLDIFMIGLSPMRQNFAPGG
ncbi:MAG: hypothetical protein WDO70_00140 [Alphaproteobacteria bacterium]